MTSIHIVQTTNRTFPVFRTQVDGDLFPRLIIQGDGTILTGTGSAPPSTGTGVGATGATGAPGSVLYNGVGAPGAGVGINGDYYLDTSLQDFYGPKAAGIWPGTPLSNFKGATGAQGLPGTQGPTGAAGSNGTNGSTGPTGASANNVTLAKQTSALTTTVATLADIPGLAFAVVAGRRYIFRANGSFRTADITVGAQLGFSGPAMTNFRSRVLIDQGAGGVSHLYSNTTGVVTDSIGSLSAQAIATDYMWGIEAVFQPSASGTLQLRGAAEVAATQVIFQNDGLAELVDADSTVSGGGGNILTDVAWAVKGDMVQATGNDSAAIVPIGANGSVWTADSAASTGASWQTPSSVAGAQANLGLLTKSGSTYTGTCRTHGVISTGTVAATVVQALWDHCCNFVGNTGHKGGTVYHAVDEIVLLTKLVTRAGSTATAGESAATTVYPLCIKGDGNLARPSATTSADGGIVGTVFRWGGASAPTGNGAVIDASNDCHGWRFEDFAIDGNAIAPKCAVSAGRRAVWQNVQFRHPITAGFTGGGLTPGFGTTVGIGLLITNGSDTASDRYVQQRCMNCDFIGASGGIGLAVAETGAGSGCTDGRVFDLQMNGCNEGGVYLGSGGWNYIGGHLTMNNSGGARKWGIWLDAGFLHTMGYYVDITGLGPNIYVTNNNFSVSNCFLISNGKVNPATYPLISVGSSKGSVTGNTWGGSDTCSRFIEGTGTGPAIANNSGPVASLGAASNKITASSFTNIANNISY